MKSSSLILPFFLASLLLHIPTIVADDTVLLDFDQANWKQGWSVGRNTVVARKPLPDFPPNEPLAPSDRAIRIVTKGKSGASIRLSEPVAWKEKSELAVWIFREKKDGDESPVMEISLLEPRQATGFWTKLKIDHVGWKQYRVPLRWMRWTKNDVPVWKDVKRVSFWFRTAADVWVDQVTVGSVPGATSTIQAEDLKRLVCENSYCRVLENQHVLIATNCEKIEIETLAEHLEKVSKRLDRDFPYLPKGVGAVPLVICNTKREYQQFASNLAAKLSSSVRVPQSGGFTVHGIAMSYFEPKYGTLRPVYLHEFVHGVMARKCRLPNSNEWFHEGLASWYQQEYHPQARFDLFVKTNVQTTAGKAPLQSLCNGKPIRSSDYWRALKLIELLKTNREYRDELPKLFKRFREVESTNLDPFIQSLGGWDELTSRWRAHCLK